MGYAYTVGGVTWRFADLKDLLESNFAVLSKFP